MRVDIWSIVCPWCYVGKARFAQLTELFSRALDQAWDRQA